MGMVNTISYMYGEYLMNPQVRSNYNHVNKNSFGRFVNSYYGKHSLYKKTLPFKNASGVLEFKDEVKDLQDSLKALVQEKEVYEDGNEDALADALTDFVEEYNTVRESFQMVEEQEFQDKAAILDAVADSHKKELSSIGIICEEDGRLTIGEDGLDITNTGLVESLFFGEGTFASRLAKKAEKLGQQALSLLSPAPRLYGGDGSIDYAVTAGTLFSTWC